MNITHEGTDIIGYYCMCIYFVLISIIISLYYVVAPMLYSDILHVLMGVSVTKLIIYITLYYYLFAIINVLLLHTADTT